MRSLSRLWEQLEQIYQSEAQLDGGPNDAPGAVQAGNSVAGEDRGALAPMYHLGF